MIDDATLKNVTAKLLFESLTTEDREKLLVTALTSLMEPQPRTQFGGTTKSKLQEKFEDAAEIAAGRLLMEYFETPEVRERVKTFVIVAAEKAFSGEFVQKLTERMLNGLWSER